ncbi:hypothetical protein G7046_g3155 [Stylonectria norvegica]|nr:hypothetical protein G7046_g3155 [Stylonectria norvegica]
MLSLATAAPFAPSSTSTLRITRQSTPADATRPSPFAPRGIARVTDRPAPNCAGDIWHPTYRERTYSYRLREGKPAISIFSCESAKSLWKEKLLDAIRTRFSYGSCIRNNPPRRDYCLPQQPLQPDISPSCS